MQVAECANGGVPLFVRRVAEGLNGEFAFGIACPPSSELYRRPPSGATVHPVNIAHRIDPLKDLLSAIRVREIVRRCGYDLVHLNSSKAGVIGVLVRGRLPAETIFTPHALKSQAYSSGSFLRKVALLVEKAICRSVGTVVAVSAEEERQIIQERLASPQRVRLIENGVDLDEASAPSTVSRADIGVPDGAFLVGTVGRMCTQKDPLVFVEAASLLVRQIPNAHFIIVGDGPLEGAVRSRIASLGMSDRFHLLGWRADATEVLNLFDVFVLASRYEGMPFTLLEAAAARKPLACTAAPGVSSLIEHGANGLLADVGDWRTLARRVGCLYEDPNMRSKLAGEAFETVARPRSLELMLDQWRDLYRSITGDSPPTSAAEAVLQVGE